MTTVCAYHELFCPFETTSRTAGFFPSSGGTFAPRDSNHSLSVNNGRSVIRRLDFLFLGIITPIGHLFFVRCFVYWDQALWRRRDFIGRGLIRRRRIRGRSRPLGRWIRSRRKGASSAEGASEAAAVRYWTAAINAAEDPAVAAAPEVEEAELAPQEPQGTRAHSPPMLLASYRGRH